MTRLWLAVLAASAIANAQPSFEAASVKPTTSNDRRRAELRLLPGGGVSIVAIPLYMIVAVAYDVPYQGQTNRLTGGPAWVRSERFDIQAKAPPGTTKDLAARARIERTRAMLRSLLEERFRLVVHHEGREGPVYALSIAKGGPKLKLAAFRDDDCPDDGSCHALAGGQGLGLHGKAVDLSDLAAYLENWTDRPVVNLTGVEGLFAIDTDGWASMFPPGIPPGPPLPPPGSASVSDARPSLFTVLARVGLKLEATKATVDVVVIERIERPSAN